jgi:hypothetical protein
MADVTLSRGGRSRAVALDHEIEELLRDFIPLGMKLMEMRDSRLYLDLENQETGEPFGTFEEYCRVKRSIAAQHAQRTIRASLVARCIDETSATKLVGEGHARLLVEAVAEFDYEVRDHGGRGDKVPVAVSNPDELRKVWAGVAEKYAAAFKRAKEKKPKLTASFIAKALPPKYRSRLPNPLLTRGKIGKTETLVKAAGRLVDVIVDMGLDDLDTLKPLAVKEAWTAEDVADVREAMKEVGDAIGSARSALSRLRL